MGLLDKIGYEKADGGETRSEARRKLLGFFLSCFPFIFFSSSSLGVTLFIYMLKCIFNILTLFLYHIWCINASFLNMTQ